MTNVIIFIPNSTIWRAGPTNRGNEQVVSEADATHGVDALALPRVSPPEYGTRLFASTVCLWNETRLLNRYMYKMKNQHRSTPYFHRLQLLSRTLRRLATVEASLQSAYEQRSTTAVPSDEMLRQQMQLVGQLADKIREACQLSYKYLESVYSDTFFVPLTVTGLAMVSRINACASQILTTDLPEAQEKMLDKRSSPT